MKIIGIGDLVTDYYFLNGEFKGICGGMTSFNIISHLARDFETYAIGVCGDDDEGIVAQNSLKDLGVNIDNIIIKSTSTRCFYISINDRHEFSIKSKKSCPLCGNKKWYDTSLIEKDIPKSLINKENILIIDTINKDNLYISEKFIQKGGRVFIDIGQIGNLKYLTLKELRDKLVGTFEVVQLNERVAEFLVRRFKLNDLKELNEIFGSKILTITHGKKGATFVYNGKQIYFETKNIAKEIDPSGAGDSFYSEVIRAYINSGFIVSDEMISKAYENASKTSSQVVQVLGARGTLQKLYNKEKTNNCICGGDPEKEKKKRNTKKTLVNISNLKDRVIRSLESDGYDQIVKEFQNSQNGGSILFIGTGGSRTTAYFASRVINELYGTTCLFLNPRDIMFRNNKDVRNLYAFSYSGTSPDILYVVNNSNFRCTIISKKKKEKISNNYTSTNINYISYGNAKYCTGRERGFLSFEGTVAPAALFAKLYYNKQEHSKSFEEFLEQRFDYWETFYKKYFNENKKILTCLLDKKNLLDIFFGDYTTTAALDLESKIVESGVYRVELHEKKNFSHGRFITNEHYMADVVIYFKSNRRDKYELCLEEYFKKNSNNIITIESEYDGILGEFDLLLAVQFFVANISKLLDIDLSSPGYSDDAMKLYRYKGNL